MWFGLIVLSLIPVLTLKTRIEIAKDTEIELVRRALRHDDSALAQSQFGPRLADFGFGDLMIYEERIKNVWEWPLKAHIRRLLLFGLLPPLTWVMAAAVEVGFESVLVGG